MTISSVKQAIANSGADALDLLQAGRARLVSIFGSEHDGARHICYILDCDGQYRVFSTRVRGAVPAATAITPAAAWYEREAHERFGIEFDGHPDLRPLLTHGPSYPFLKVGGEGVCEVAVGPVHAGIIEPGHFRFSVVGDTVLHLELRHFYTHKGTEKLFEGAPILAARMIAESVSGDNCFAHAVAYCEAVENALGIAVPPRACAIRLVGLELERMLAHIGDVGALCGDVGFSVPSTYTARIKESLLQASARLLGTRLWKGIAVPGGVRRDLNDERAAELSRIVGEAAADFAEMAQIVLDTPSVQNRFESTGILKLEVVRDLAVVGPVARASGAHEDIRRDHPYGSYRETAVEVPHFHYGDVLGRARIRIEETRVSTALIQQTLRKLPSGSICTRLTNAATGEGLEGLAAIESPRGELLYWLRLREGRVVRCHIKSPSFQNWPALPHAMTGNIIADFPLINKSFNLSYSGCDR
jgi:Ni,Fe-hydrogenase III large subunit